MVDSLFVGCYHAGAYSNIFFEYEVVRSHWSFGSSLLEISAHSLIVSGLMKV